MVLLLFSLSILCGTTVYSHEYYPAQCPNFTPMASFNWDKFSSGIWYVTQKFATKSSCLTYQFKSDDLGFKSIEQVRQLPYTERIGLDHEYIYTGKLYTPQESSPAKMLVRFPLNVVGSSSFTVVDTDYNNYAMVCTCQDVDLFFTYAHRRSCSILQRVKEEDTQITNKMKKLLDSQIENASHDFDKIKQEDCEHDKEKSLNIDVDKILGFNKYAGVSAESEDYGESYGDYEPDAEVLTNKQLKEAVASVASEYEFNQKTLDEIKEEAKNQIEGTK